MDIPIRQRCSLFVLNPHFMAHKNHKLLMIFAGCSILLATFSPTFDPYELWTMLFKAHVMSSQTDFAQLFVLLRMLCLFFFTLSFSIRRLFSPFGFDFVAVFAAVFAFFVADSVAFLTKLKISFAREILRSHFVCRHKKWGFLLILHVFCMIERPEQTSLNN